VAVVLGQSAVGVVIGQETKEVDVEKWMSAWNMPT
jgi:hypothetical protein